MEEKKQRGGARKGAGRKPVADEKKANEIFIAALKNVYKKDNDDEAKIGFAEELLESQRGQIFIAEHVFGKAKDVVESTHKIKEGFSLKDMVKFDKPKQ